MAAVGRTGRVGWAVMVIVRWQRTLMEKKRRRILLGITETKMSLGQTFAMSTISFNAVNAMSA